MKSKQATITPLAPPAKPSAALPPPLVAGLFAEADVMLRPGRAEIIGGSLGAAVAKFRTVAHKLAFEREPGLFPVDSVAVKKGKRK